MVLSAGILKTEQLLAAEYTKLGVGTSNSAVNPADTALTGAVIKSVTSVLYVGGGIFQLVATLAGSDPAMTIQEVGVYNSADQLCYRKVVDPRVKSAGLSYTITYQIKVQ